MPPTGPSIWGQGQARRRVPDEVGVALAGDAAGGDLGRVAAGEPIEALEDRDTVEVPESFLGTGEHFALRVRGDSMIGDGIHDGDLILLRQQEDAENGQTVVAIVDGSEATLKKFYHEGDRIRLEPANPETGRQVRREFVARFIEVADEHVGQPMLCPLCNRAFTTTGGTACSAAVIAARVRVW